jgi:hypothetical protein
VRRFGLGRSIFPGAWSKLNVHLGGLPMTAASHHVRSQSVLIERGWCLRLHAGSAPPAIVTAARRVVRAALAAPGEEAVGFAFLRPVDDGWALAAHIWRGGELLREALLLPHDGGPPRRCPDLARSLGEIEDVTLLAREAAAWQRHGGEAETYLGEASS